MAKIRTHEQTDNADKLLQGNREKIDLVLYTGPHCELCDHAMDVYKTLPTAILDSLSLSTQNIRDDSALYHLYALRIPVIKRLDNQQELGWPFDLESLMWFLIKKY